MTPTVDRPVARPDEAILFDIGPARIAVESPLQAEIRELVAELDAVLLSLAPPEFCFRMTAEQMAEGDTTVFVGRIDGRAVAVGALRCHGNEVGEVKRMYTRPAARGRGLGAAILAAIESSARSHGLTRLVLETGDNHHAARRLYERAGFAQCRPVLDYPCSSCSVFYEKALAG